MTTTDDRLAILEPLPGQCLCCGGRGGYPGPPTGVMACGRCHGTGRDPSRGENWDLDLVLPHQGVELPAVGS